MKIPAFWAKASVEETDRDGKKVSFSCWRPSDRSQEEAHESALDAAKRVLQSLMSGNRLDRYAYGETPLREETLEKFTNDRGDLVGAITRNAYGALVLNTDRIMFIDLDFPAITPGESLRYFFTRIFNKSAPSPEARREAEAKTRLEQFLSGKPEWGLRLYRTCAGLRALVTHDCFDPASDAALAILQAVGSDPLYVRLCKAQKCFRARLTPKPWRCGHKANPVRWPIENNDQQSRFERWEADYLAKQPRYATCRLLGTMGNGVTHPEVTRIVEIHDKLTRCQESLELA
jgi:hypothetical protein